MNEKPENEKSDNAQEPQSDIQNIMRSLNKDEWLTAFMKGQPTDYKGAWESLLLVVKYSPKLQGIQEVINDIEELYKIKK
jgi:hypothetical protein